MITGTKLLWQFVATVLASTAISFAPASAAPIYVDASATGSNNGTSWANAYVDLQDAIDQAWNNPSSYPEIRVAQGRYTPDGGSLDQTAVFHLVNNVEIKGGYGGLQASDPDERDALHYETILSGDLVGNDNYCDLYNNREDNSFKIVTGTEPDGFTLVDSSAVLDGFTVTGAYGSAIFLDTASGVGASPTIRNCKISYNYAAGGNGAGIYCRDNSLAEILNCVIEGNVAKFGSGIYLGRFASARIEDCYFAGNQNADRGGGLYVADRAEPRIERCRFEANASGGGGAIAIAPSFADTRPFISDCQFINNIVDGGGVRGSTQASFAIRNCLFWGNTSSDSGMLAKQISTAGPTPTVSYSSIQGCSGCFGGTTTMAAIQHS